MTDNRTTELLPCPFCGGEDIDEYEGDYGNGVYCMNCGAMMGEPIHVEFHVHERVTHEQAAEAWNTRVAVTDHEFAMAVHDGELWRRVKNHVRCRNCGLNIESVIALDGCNEHAIKHCPNCGHKVVG